jgi:hypothetical protein
MSSIILQDVDNIQYTSFKFDYLAINTVDVLDQLDDEILLVNQKNSRFSMIVKNNGLFLNSTREEAQSHVANNISLYAQNAHFEGSVTVGSIKILNNDISNANVDKLLNAITSNTGPFYPYIDPIYDTYKNYFTHNNINILANAYSHLSRSNLHPLNISRSAEYSIYNAQLAIRNNIDDNTNNESELLFGILGNRYHSPATIVTNPGKALEFYISKDNDVIDELYNQNNDIPNYKTLPTLKIDTCNCVNINSSNFKTLKYNEITDTTKLNVDGLAYIKDIFVYDHLLDKPNHLNDIYIRKGTTNFYPHQVYEGTFNGNFQFNSNVKINTLHTSNINTDTLNVYSNAKFTNITSHDINATNINFSDYLYHDTNKPLSITDIDVKLIYYNANTIRNNILDQYFYNKEEINSNIQYIILNTGIHNNKPYGINKIIYSELINNTSNQLYSTNIEYYTKTDILSNILYNFNTQGSTPVLNYIEVNSNIITYYNSNIFNSLSNNFIQTATLHRTDYLTSNLYDILYYTGYNCNLDNYIKSSVNLKLTFTNLSNILYVFPITFHENCNITSNIISNINLSGFSNLYISSYYTDNYYLNTVYSNINYNKITINNNYRIHLSNIVNNNKYTKKEIIDLIYINRINKTNIESFDFESNIEYTLDLRIIESNVILKNYSNILLYEGYSNINKNYIKNFNNFKNNLKNNLNIINIHESNLLTFNNCVDVITKHINQENNQGYYKLTSNLDVIFNTFDYKITQDNSKANIINRLLLNFITNYDTSNIQNKQLLTYHVKDYMNFNGSNVSFDGKVAIGSYNNDGSMLTITRDVNKQKNKSEILIKDIYNTGIYETYIGHKDTKDFIIKTNNIIDHNIILQAGTKPNLFLKSDSAYVGINTLNPTKSLDVNGDIIVNDYYKRHLGKDIKIYHFIEKSNKIGLLDNTTDVEFNNSIIFNNNIYINKVFRDNKELFNFERKTQTNAEYLYSHVGCLFIGQDVDKNPVKIENIENTAMFLQNSTDIVKNNTILRLLSSDKKTANKDYYTGIEITKDKLAPYSGWYLHNNHFYSNTGTEEFEIGYRNNYNIKFSILKSTYNGKINSFEIGNKDSPIVINNNLIVEGDIDVKGIYKLNGVEFSSNSIKLSTIVDNYDTNNISHSSGDISMVTSQRIINLIAKYSSIFIGQYNGNYDTDRPGYTTYLKNYSIAHLNKVNELKDQLVSDFDAKLNIVSPVNLTLISENTINPSLLAVKGTYNKSQLQESKTIKSSIRIALLDTDNIITPEYWENKNYSEVAYNLYNDCAMFSLDVKYNDDIYKPFKIITYGTHNIYTKLTSETYNLNKENDRFSNFFHIVDDYKDNLLVLERKTTKDIKLSFKQPNTKWDIIANNDFKITNDTSIFTFNNKGVGIYTSNPDASLHIHNNNNIGLQIVNTESNIASKSKTYITTDKISDLNIINFSNQIIYNINSVKTNNTTSNILFESNIIIKKSYNSNFNGKEKINNIINSLYSNYYSYNINYINNSNFTFNININRLLLNEKLQSNFNSSNITNVNLNSNIYTISNIDKPNVNVRLNTIDILNNYLILSNNALTSNNYHIYLASNIINTQLMCNFTYNDINIYIYHPINYNYNYSFNASIDVDLKYTIKTNVISGIHKELKITSNFNNIYNIDYLNDNYKKDYQYNIINNLKENIIIDGYSNLFNFNDITLNYYDVNRLSNCNVLIDIILPQYHIKLKDNNKNYYINGKNSNFDIIYQDNDIIKPILNLTNNSVLTIDKLIVKDISITGSIYDDYANIFCNEEFNTINIKNNHLYVNTENNFSILFNTDYINNYNIHANVIFGNKNRNTDQLISLQSSTNNSYIDFITLTENDIYKLGKTDNHFNLLHNNDNVLKISKNNSFITISNIDAIDTNNDGIISSTELSLSTNIISSIINTNYDYDFNNGRLQNIKNINYTSNLVFTENQKISMVMNKDDITIHKRLICNSGVTTGSDSRIKENINIIENALDKIDKLNGVSYYNKLSGFNEIGLIAQDVQKVIPEVVSDEGLVLGIQYGNMIALLIEGIKELRKEIKNGQN